MNQGCERWTADRRNQSPQSATKQNERIKFLM
jgi:hypothetical protein